jgi:hypothetical protein
MKRFKDVEHLLRLAGLFVAGILVFGIARAEFVPKDFGRLGHFRPAAIDDVRARPLEYAGRARCAECHDDIVTLKAAARHRNIGCESCHGPQLKHADAPENAPGRPDGRTTCVRCHATKTGKPTQYPRVDIQDHAGDEKCITCHKPHDPRIQ